MQLSTPDGRSLDLVTAGDSGPAIVFHHGTPSAAEDSPDWIATAQAAGFRWVSYTRAGYGGSTRRPGRSVADNCTDITAVCDQLGIERFVSMGWSGGGPHALACGALLPRCAAVVLLAGVAPFEGAAEAGLDWLAGMGEENLEEFGAAMQGEAPLRALLEQQRPQYTGITGAEVADALGGLVDQPDRAVLTGAFAEHVAASFREAMRLGVDGWVDDDLAFARHWGFELADVRVPVALWQGEDDRMVPFAHGPFQIERLTDVRAHLLAGEGHLSIALGMFTAVMAEARSLIAG